MTTVHKDVQSFSGGTFGTVAVNNVNDTTPTKAELTSSFGTPASHGASGIVGVVNDAGAGTNVYIVATEGVDYYWLKVTKAL